MAKIGLGVNMEFVRHDDKPRDIVFSLECGTVEQAARSVEHLKALL